MKNQKESPVKHTARYVVLAHLIIGLAFSACSDTNEASLHETLKRNSEIKARQEAKKASAADPNRIEVVVTDRPMTPEERRIADYRMTPEEIKALLKKKNVFKDGDYIIEVTTVEASSAK